MKKLIRTALICFTIAPLALSANSATGYLKYDYVSGLYRVCVYDVLGSEAAITINSVSLCPLTANF